MPPVFKNYGFLTADTGSVGVRAADVGEGKATADASHPDCFCRPGKSHSDPLHVHTTVEQLELSWYTTSPGKRPGSWLEPGLLDYLSREQRACCGPTSGFYLSKLFKMSCILMTASRVLCAFWFA